MAIIANVRLIKTHQAFGSFPVVPNESHANSFASWFQLVPSPAYIDAQHVAAQSQAISDLRAFRLR